MLRHIQCAIVENLCLDCIFFSTEMGMPLPWSTHTRKTTFHTQHKELFELCTNFVFFFLTFIHHSFIQWQWSASNECKVNLRHCRWRNGKKISLANICTQAMLTINISVRSEIRMTHLQSCKDSTVLTKHIPKIKHFPHLSGFFVVYLFVCFWLLYL